MKRIKLKWILLSVVSLYIVAVVFAWVNNGDRIRASFYKFIESMNQPAFRELAAITISRDPEKSEKLANFDEHHAKAAWYAARREYANMHKALSDSVKDAEGAFGPKSEYLRIALINQGEKECKFEKWKVAIEAFNRALKIDPKDISVSSWLGYAYCQDNDYKDAIDVYTKAIANKATAQLCVERAYAHSSLGEYKEAIDDCNKAIPLNPNYGRSFFERGCAQQQLGQYSQAIDDIRASLQSDPNNIGAYRHLGYLYKMSGQPDKAIDALTTAIKLDPTLGRCYFARADLYSYLGKTALAEKDLVEAKKRGFDPDAKQTTDH
jgi:tetratricopeptide (TPR) repeat protein